MNEQPLTVFEITLARTIQPDGQQGFILTMPDEFSFIEALGLIEAARWQLYAQMSQKWFGERS